VRYIKFGACLFKQFSKFSSLVSLDDWRCLPLGLCCVFPNNATLNDFIDWAGRLGLVSI